MTVDHLALALVQLVSDHAHEAFVAVYVQMLDGFENLAVGILLQNNLRPADRKFEALAAHGFYKDGELEFTTALYDKGIMISGFLHLDGHVTQGFLLQALLNDPALQKLAFAAGEGRSIDAEAHGDGRFVNRDARQGCRMLTGADGIADGHVLDAGENHDLTGLHFLDLLELHALVDLQLEGTQRTLLSVRADAVQRLVVVNRTVDNAADGKAAQVVGIVQIRNQHLERHVRIVGRSRQLVDYGFKKRGQILALVIRMVHRHAVAAHCVQHREIQLLVVGAEVDEEIVIFVKNFLDAGVFAIDLINNDHNGKFRLQGLMKNKSGLGERTFRRIHEQNGSACHGQGAFDLSAKVGMAWGVNDVDLDSLPGDGAVFGSNCDAALAFEVPVIHNAVGNFLVGSENATLFKKRIHKGGLTVVDMGYNSHIAKFLVLHLNASS